jgi:hypothetical protein
MTHRHRGGNDFPAASISTRKRPVGRSSFFVAIPPSCRAFAIDPSVRTNAADQRLFFAVQGQSYGPMSVATVTLSTCHTSILEQADNVAAFIDAPR